MSPQRRRRRNRTTLVIGAMIFAMIGLFWVLSIFEDNEEAGDRCTAAGGVWSTSAKLCLRPYAVIDLEGTP